MVLGSYRIDWMREPWAVVNWQTIATRGPCVVLGRSCPMVLGPWVVAFFHRIPAIEAKTLIYIALSHKIKIFGSFFGRRGLGPCSSQKFIRYFVSEQSVLYKGR